MARIVYGMNLSLDGYADHEHFAPDLELFLHWTEQVASLAGCLYGRRIYEIMRYWDEDRPEWTPAERDFAAAWRARPKWVVSRGQLSLGPNATLVEGDLETAVRALKDRHDGEIDVAGPGLAASLSRLGLVDEYRLYYHPVVLGRGTRFFAAPPPPLRLVSSERIGAEAIRLTYVPARPQAAEH